MDSNHKDGNGLPETCLQYFNSGFSCSEAVLIGASRYLDIHNNIIPGIATPFAGGVSRKGHGVCGALSGAMMAIGLKYGRNTSTGDRSVAFKKAVSLIDRFKEEYGTLNCIEIIGLEGMSEEEIQKRKQHTRDTICRPLVEQVGKWIQEELTE